MPMPVTSSGSGGKIRDTYFELVRRFPLRPIRTEKELDEATRIIDELVTRTVPLDYGESAYLDVLSDLTAKYESLVHPIQPATDAEVLALLIDAGGMTKTDFAKMVAISVSTVSEVISGKRRLTREQVGRVAESFKIAPTAFAVPQR